MIQLQTDHPENINLHFFYVSEGSATVIRNKIDLFEEKCSNYDWGTPIPRPFRNILITPIKIGPKSKFLPEARKLKKEGLVDRVIFDSGGFQLMTGSLAKKGVRTLDDLIRKDRQLYQEHNDWVDVFMSLDDPPTLSDTHAVMRKKIQETIDISLRFFHEMPPEVQAKMVPIYHCRYLEQVDQFNEAYKPIIDKSGFVSYSAASCTNAGAIRSIKENIMLVLQKIVKDQSEVHCLGIASPLAVFMMAYLGIRTYDGSSVSQAAGNGETYWPYLRSVPFSDRDHRIPRVPSVKGLEKLKELTGHHCPFCENRQDLIDNSDYRFMHNLIVQDQLSYIYRDLDFDKFASMQSSDKYIRLIRKILLDKEQLSFF